MSNPDPGSGSPSPTVSQADSGDASKAPQAGTDANGAKLTPAQYEAIIADLRKENGANRSEKAELLKKVTAFEKAQADVEAANLSDIDKANKRAAEAEALLNDRTRASQERIINYEIRLNAANLGIVDPEAAVKLLDWSKLKYDDDGIPTNAAELVQALVKDKPYLIAPAGKPPVSSGGASNPSKSSTSMSATALNWDVISQMTEAEYTARRAEIATWIMRNPRPR